MYKLIRVSDYDGITAVLKKSSSIEEVMNIMSRFKLKNSRFAARYGISKRHDCNYFVLDPEGNKIAHCEG